NDGCVNKPIRIDMTPRKSFVFGLISLVFLTGSLLPGQTITVVSGNGVVAEAPFPAADLLVVVVRDASGLPVPNATVNWAVTSGIGSINPAQSITDANGQTSAQFFGGILGTNSFLQSVVSATTNVAGVSPPAATFTVTTVDQTAVTVNFALSSPPP